jgi:uncharacterized protein DUF3307
MITISLTLLATHWLADFVLQSDWMAVNKSSSNTALGLHCLTYSACFLWWGWQFALLTLGCHFVQDYITSRVNSKLWRENKRHWFFVGVGFDQLLHYAQLALTLRLLG